MYWLTEKLKTKQSKTTIHVRAKQLLDHGNLPFCACTCIWNAADIIEVVLGSIFKGPLNVLFCCHFNEDIFYEEDTSVGKSSFHRIIKLGRWLIMLSSSTWFKVKQITHFTLNQSSSLYAKYVLNI